MPLASWKWPPSVIDTRNAFFPHAGQSANTSGRCNFGLIDVRSWGMFVRFVVQIDRVCASSVLPDRTLNECHFQAQQLA
jgi:hypothetical protein